MEITSEASHIIGLTGLPSVGKGEVACALAGLAAKRGWRLASISFSDQIKVRWSSGVTGSPTDMPLADNPAWNSPT